MELVVAIAILSLLLAILLPVFAQARAKAQQSTCLSNLRQVSLAVLNYTQDNDETMPNGTNQTSPGNATTGAGYGTTGYGRAWPGAGWAGQCFPYIRQTTVLRCPLDPTLPRSRFESVVSYALNSNLAGHAEPGDPIAPGESIAALGATSRTVLLFEVSGVNANVTDLREGTDNQTTGTHLSATGNGLDNRLYAQKDWTTRIENQYATGYLGGRKPFDPTATQFLSPTGRHNNGTNYAFADGHVRLLRGSQVSSGRNASAETCPQDGALVLGCGDAFQAAGTSDPLFAGTFSIR